MGVERCMQGIINATIAKGELEDAKKRNPGPWIAHSQYAGLAAKCIAKACGMDCEKAYILGLLHDIGRRNGVSAMRHTIDGYDYAMERGWKEVARVCLTHSFPIQDIETDVAKRDVTDRQYQFMKSYLETVEYDDYDKLIILCDSLAEASGFCILEKRFVDVARRYGVYPFTVERWNRVYQCKDYFESKIGKSIYTLLPGIGDCIFHEN